MPVMESRDAPHDERPGQHDRRDGLIEVRRPRSVHDEQEYHRHGNPDREVAAAPLPTATGGVLGGQDRDESRHQRDGEQGLASRSPQVAEREGNETDDGEGRR